MNTELDLKVNFADDIVFDGIDLVVETNSHTAAIKNAQRRISAKQTDFPLRSEIAAGIESFLQERINDFMLSDMEMTIRSCMTMYGLFDNVDFNVLFDTTDTTKLGVIISFNNIGQDTDTFSVFVDIQNQRSYS